MQRSAHCLERGALGKLRFLYPCQVPGALRLSLGQDLSVPHKAPSGSQAWCPDVISQKRFLLTFRSEVIQQVPEAPGRHQVGSGDAWRRTLLPEGAMGEKTHPPCAADTVGPGSREWGFRWRLDGAQQISPETVSAFRDLPPIRLCQRLPVTVQGELSDTFRTRAPLPEWRTPLSSLSLRSEDHRERPLCLLGSRDSLGCLGGFRPLAGTVLFILHCVCVCSNTMSAASMGRVSGRGASPLCR